MDVLWTWSVWQRTLCVCKTDRSLPQFGLNSTFLTYCNLFLLFLFHSFSHRCDKGYGGAHCVPLAPLPSVLREDFNENLQQDTWPEVYGAERGTLSGEPLKSGTALIFKGVRVLSMCRKHSEQNLDIYVTIKPFVLFIFRMGWEWLCQGIWTARTPSTSSSLSNLSPKVLLRSLCSLSDFQNVTW